MHRTRIDALANDLQTAVFQMIDRELEADGETAGRIAAAVESAFRTACAIEFDGPQPLPTWTVIGFYDDTTLAYCGHFPGKTADDAAAACAAVAARELVILGVIPRSHELLFVSDSERGVYVEDIPQN